jgi:hypothetical protein
MDHVFLPHTGILLAGWEQRTFASVILEATASFGMGDDASPCDLDANLCQDQDVSVLRAAWLEMNDA